MSVADCVLGLGQQPLALGKSIELTHHLLAMRDRLAGLTEPFQHDRQLRVRQGERGIDPDRLLENRSRIAPAAVVPRLQALDVELVGRQRARGHVLERPARRPILDVERGADARRQRIDQREDVLPLLAAGGHDAAGLDILDLHVDANVAARS